LHAHAAKLILPAHGAKTGHRAKVHAAGSPAAKGIGDIIGYGVRNDLPQREEVVVKRDGIGEKDEIVLREANHGLRHMNGRRGIIGDALKTRVIERR